MRRLLIVLLLATCVGMNFGMQRWYNEIFTAPDREASALNVLLDALGEVRTFVAQSIWFQIDLYHHEMEEQGIPWTDEKDLMSMYRMVTTLDPRFAEAYDVASYQLVKNFHKPLEGLQYLDEGLKYNPDSAMLHFDKAFLLQYLKRDAEAEPEALRAMSLYAPDPAALLQMNELDQIPFLNALRVFTHSANSLGQREQELHGLRIWLMLRPGDPYPTQRMRALGEPPVGYTPDQFLQMLRGR